MIAGAKEGALGQTDMTCDCDGCEIQQAALLADPDMVTHFQSPGKMNINLGANNHAATDFGAEQPQPENSNLIGQREGRGKKQTAHQHPQNFFPPRRTTVKTGIVESGKVHRKQNAEKLKR